MQDCPPDYAGPGRQAATGAKGTPRGTTRSAIFNLQSSMRVLGDPLAPVAAWRPGPAPPARRRGRFANPASGTLQWAIVTTGCWLPGATHGSARRYTEMVGRGQEGGSAPSARDEERR